MKNINRGLLFLTLILLSCTPQSMSEPVSASRMLLGTTCVITIFDMKKPSAADRVLNESFVLIDDLEKRVSVHKRDSEISVLNRDRAARLSPDSLLILDKALAVARDSEGRFDPTVGRLVSLWDIGGENPRVPMQSEIDSVLPGISYRDIRRIEDGEGDNVMILNPASRIDLGGIAKGHAADLVSEHLKSSGVRSAIINLGGNVQLVGTKPDGSKWKIGIQKPDDSRGEFMGILNTPETAVVTSGIYERFFVWEGKRYHHILDTADGYPVDNGLQSLTVICSTSTEADGLSTALFAMGMEKAAAYAEERDDLDIIAVNADNEVWASSGIRKAFTLTDKSYTALY
jgi:thiamine biosynthesis lipoprotein